MRWGWPMLLGSCASCWLMPAACRGWLTRLKTVTSDLAEFERLQTFLALLCTEHKIQLSLQDVRAPSLPSFSRL